MADLNISDDFAESHTSLKRVPKCTSKASNATKTKRRGIRRQPKPSNSNTNIETASGVKTTTAATTKTIDVEIDLTDDPNTDEKLSVVAKKQEAVPVESQKQEAVPVESQLCRFCNQPVSASDHATHLRLCMQEKFARKNSRLSPDVADTVEERVPCSVCGNDLSYLSVINRNIHVNRCIDAQGPSYPKASDVQKTSEKEDAKDSAIPCTSAQTERESSTTPVPEVEKIPETRWRRVLEEGGSCPVCEEDVTGLNKSGRVLHMNVCIDKTVRSKKKPQAPDKKKEPVLECPLCGQPFKTKNSRKTHLKSCAKKLGVDTATLMARIKQQEEEHAAFLQSLRHSDVTASVNDVIKSRAGVRTSKAGATRKRGAGNPRGRRDPLPRPNCVDRVLKEHTDLAMALSNSMLEQKKSDQPTGSVETSAKNAYAILMSPANQLTEAPKRGKKKKRDDNYTPAVVVETVDERNKKLGRKLELIITASDREKLLSTPSFKQSALGKRYQQGIEDANSKSKLKTLWDLNNKAMESVSTEAFYVTELRPPLEPRTAPLGVIAQRLHEKARPVRAAGQTDQQPKADPRRSSMNESMYLSTQTAVLLAQLAADETTLYLPGTEHAQEQLDLHCKAEKRLLESLATLVDSGSGSDVTIETRHGQVQGHSLLLNLRCPHLMKMCDNGVINLTDTDKDVILILLRYLYASDVSFDPTYTRALLHLARRFRFDELHSICESMLEASGADLDPAAEIQAPADETLQALLADAWGTETESSDNEEDTVQERAGIAQEAIESDEYDSIHRVLTQRVARKASQTDTECSEQKDQLHMGPDCEIYVEDSDCGMEDDSSHDSDKENSQDKMRGQLRAHYMTLHERMTLALFEADDDSNDSLPSNASSVRDIDKDVTIRYPSDQTCNSENNSQSSNKENPSLGRSRYKSSDGDINYSFNRSGNSGIHPNTNAKNFSASKTPDAQRGKNASVSSMTPDLFNDSPDLFSPGSTSSYKNRRLDSIPNSANPTDVICVDVSRNNSTVTNDKPSSAIDSDSDSCEIIQSQELGNIYTPSSPQLQTQDTLRSTRCSRSVARNLNKEYDRDDILHNKKGIDDEFEVSILSPLDDRGFISSPKETKDENYRMEDIAMSPSDDHRFIASSRWSISKGNYGMESVVVSSTENMVGSISSSNSSGQVKSRENSVHKRKRLAGVADGVGTEGLENKRHKLSSSLDWGHITEMGDCFDNVAHSPVIDIQTCTGSGMKTRNRRRKTAEASNIPMSPAQGTSTLRRSLQADRASVSLNRSPMHHSFQPGGSRGFSTNHSPAIHTSASIPPNSVSIPPTSVSTAPSSVSTADTIVSIPPICVSTAPTSVSTSPLAVSTSTSDVSNPPKHVSELTSRDSTSPTGVATSRNSTSPTGVATSRDSTSPTGVTTIRGSTSPTGVASSRYSISPAGVATAPSELIDLMSDSPLSNLHSDARSSQQPRPDTSRYLDAGNTTDVWDDFDDGVYATQPVVKLTQSTPPRFTRPELTTVNQFEPDALDNLDDHMIDLGSSFSSQSQQSGSQTRRRSQSVQTRRTASQSGEGHGGRGTMQGITTRGVIEGNFIRWRLGEEGEGRVDRDVGGMGMGGREEKGVGDGRDSATSSDFHPLHFQTTSCPVSDFAAKSKSKKFTFKSSQKPVSSSAANASSGHGERNGFTSDRLGISSESQSVRVKTAQYSAITSDTVVSSRSSFGNNNRCPQNSHVLDRAPVRSRGGHRTLHSMPSDSDCSPEQSHTHNAGRGCKNEALPQLKMARKPLATRGEVKQVDEEEDEDDYDPPTDMSLNESGLPSPQERTTKMKTPAVPRGGRRGRKQPGEWVPPSPFTPMPDYSTLPTPQLQREAAKMGLRHFPKKKMVNLLKNIYEAGHQYETDPEFDQEAVEELRVGLASPEPATVDIQSRDKNNTKAARKIRTKQPTSAAVSKRGSKSSILNPNPDSDSEHTIGCVGNKKTGSASTIGKKIAKTSKKPTKRTTAGGDCVGASADAALGAPIMTTGCAWGGFPARRVSEDEESVAESNLDASMDKSDCDSVLEETILQASPSKQLSKRDVEYKRQQIWDFIHTRKDILIKILHYEPLEFDDFHKGLKDAGLTTIGTSIVAEFLDDKCIPYTMRKLRQDKPSRHLKKRRPKNTGSASQSQRQ